MYKDCYFILFTTFAFLVSSNLWSSDIEALTLHQTGYHYERLGSESKLEPLFLGHVASFGFDEKHIFVLGNLKQYDETIGFAVVDRKTHKFTTQKRFKAQSLAWMQGPLEQIFPLKDTTQVVFLTHEEINNNLIPCLNILDYKTGERIQKTIPTDRINLMLAPFENQILIYQSNLSHFIAYDHKSDSFSIYKPGQKTELELPGVGYFQIAADGEHSESVAVGQTLPKQYQAHLHLINPQVIFSQKLDDQIVFQVREKTSTKTSLLILTSGQNSPRALALPDGSGRVIAHQRKLSYFEANHLVTTGFHNTKMKTRVPTDGNILTVSYVF